jgi:hypothetical protein
MRTLRLSKKLPSTKFLLSKEGWRGYFFTPDFVRQGAHRSEWLVQHRNSEVGFAPDFFR